MNLNKDSLFTLNVNDVSADRGLAGVKSLKGLNPFDPQNPEKAYTLDLSTQMDKLKLQTLL
jgi:hypothetical protein